jgi:hypothetical protein
MKSLQKPTLLLILAGTLALAGCATVGEPAAIDPATGRIKTQSIYGETKASLIKSDRVALSKYRPLILTLGGKFFKEQTVKFGYFESVVNREDMEQLLIREGKSDVVSDVTNLLSWKKIADNYKPFLVLKPEVREEGRSSYVQLKAIQADTATEVFVAEVKLDFFWKGVTDDTVFYPLYNAFIDWVNSNKGS